MSYKPTPLMIKWVEELRKPDRVQVKGVLGRKENGVVGNCCLGVLTELAGGVPSFEHGTPENHRLVYNGPGIEGASIMPPREVSRAAVGSEDALVGSADIPLGMSFGQIITAADLNDEYDFTFGEIADEIEKVYVLGDGNYRTNHIDNIERHLRKTEFDGC